MWDGAFSPDMQKRKLAPDQVSFDPENVSDDTLDVIDPESDEARGILSVQFAPGGPIYRWECTYQAYQDFEDSGFDTAWLNENAITDVGGWGWAHGRTQNNGGWGWPFGREHNAHYNPRTGHYYTE